MDQPKVYYPRALEDRWQEASRQFPVLLLTGPRQTGKTTLLRHLSEPGRSYCTLDDPTLRELAQEDPGLFLQRFPPPVLVDEIQYAPGLLPYVKIAVDQGAGPGAFGVTGSQQFLLLRGVTESLAGRVAVAHLLAMSRREAARAEARLPPFLPAGEPLEARLQGPPPSGAALYEEIWRGGLPALATGQVADRDLFYASYLQTYLERDVADLTQVGNRTAFLRFLRACAARTAQLLNLSELARDVDVSPATAKAWLSILEASHQVLLLQPYHTSRTTRLVKRPKLYLLDTGLCAYLTEWSTPETLAAGAMAGPILETYVVAEVVKSWWHRLRRPALYFYRDRDGREIDLLLEQDATLYPVEVKRAATPRREWLRPFAALDRLPLRRGPGAVLCLTERPLPLDRRTQALPAGLL
ncbi:MAG: ATP-binding protein [Nitrospirae bacterium]|nr:MAG: ATP-binding protein [Nitrospirota bacterium]